MPRFYFHVIDGQAIIDGEGTELPNVDAARLHAVAIATSLLKGTIDAWPSEHGWQIIVADTSRTVIATLAFGVKVPIVSSAKAVGP